MRGKCGVLHQTCPAPCNAGGHLHTNGGECLVKGSICRQLDEMPVWKRGIDPTIDGGEKLREMLLQAIPLVFQRVHIISKGEPRRHIHRVAHQVFWHINRLARCSHFLPTGFQTGCHRHEGREELT